MLLCYPHRELISLRIDSPDLIRLSTLKRALELTRVACDGNDFRDLRCDHLLSDLAEREMPSVRSSGLLGS